MSRYRLILVVVAVAAVGFLGCGSTKPETQAEQDTLDTECGAAIQEFKSTDPSIKKHFTEAHGYAVFPSVAKGGAGIGGAYGQGQVYQGGKVVGFATLSQATIGLQLGGQAYSEVVFFQNQGALSSFKQGEYEVSAQASAVAATAGASADADYSGGVLIITMAKGGLMYEASVGGQKFKYQAK